MRNRGGDDVGAVARRAARTPVTIHDVARAASVSIGTVSKALNRNGALRQETRDRVIAAAKKLGFRPNDLAQSLHRGQTFTVGLITSDSFGRFSIPIMEGLEEQLSGARMSVFMCNGADDPAREALHVESLLGKRVDGIVVTGRRADPRRRLEVRGANIPVLYAYSQSDEPGAFGLVPDDEGGAELAVDHLVGLGRRRIVHITGPERFEAVRLRSRRLSQVAPPSTVFPRPMAPRWSANGRRTGDAAPPRSCSARRDDRRTPSSAGTIRLRAASPTGSGRTGSKCRRTCRSWVSTTGRS